jgi:hypothetical protein
MTQSDAIGQTSLGDEAARLSHALKPLRAAPDHPALLRSRAAFAALPRKSAISTGPSENSPALALAVKTRR